MPKSQKSKDEKYRIKVATIIIDLILVVRLGCKTLKNANNTKKEVDRLQVGVPWLVESSVSNVGSGKQYSSGRY